MVNKFTGTNSSKYGCNIVDFCDMVETTAIHNSVYESNFLTSYDHRSSIPGKKLMVQSKLANMTLKTLSGTKGLPKLGV